MAATTTPSSAPANISMGGAPQVQTVPFNPNINQTVQPQQVASVVAAPAQVAQPQAQQITQGGAQNRFIQPQAGVANA